MVQVAVNLYGGEHLGIIQLLTWIDPLQSMSIMDFIAQYLELGIPKISK